MTTRLSTTMLRNYRHLTPDEQSEFQRRVIERAKTKRAEAMRGLFRALVDVVPAQGGGRPPAAA